MRRLQLGHLGFSLGAVRNGQKLVLSLAIGIPLLLEVQDVMLVELLLFVFLDAFHGEDFLFELISVKDEQVVSVSVPDIFDKVDPL